MSLMDLIKKDQLKARMEKKEVRKNLLTSLLSEAGAIGKNNGNRESTDAEVLGVVKKFIGSGEETKGLLEKSSRDTTDVSEELEILNGYMPQQLNSEALEVILNTLFASHPDMKMKDAMGYLKDNHAGAYDGKIASELTRRIFPMK